MAGVGLARGAVAVHAYDVRWPEYFRGERDLVLTALGSLCREVEHVGSTAVPGLRAKPLIDLQAGVDAIPPLDSPAVEALHSLGYQVMPERLYPGRLFLPKGPESRRTHHLNLVVIDSDDWRHPLRFRDALRADDALRDEYAALKSTLAEAHPQDRGRYTDGKADFVLTVLARS